MRSLAMYAACALLGLSVAAAAQENGSASPAAAGECLCVLPASLSVQAGLAVQTGSAGGDLAQSEAGISGGDRVVLGMDGQVVVIPGPACQALRTRFQCDDGEDPVSP